MDPITQTYDEAKEQMMDAYAETLKGLNLELHGRNDRLGLISSKNGEKPLFHAHFIEQPDDQTKVSIAPGLSNLKDRDNSERPDTAIRRILDQLESTLTNK